MGKNNLYWQNVAFAIFLIIVAALFWFFSGRVVLKVSVPVFMLYFATIVALIPFNSNKVVASILNRIVVPLELLYKLCETKNGRKALTASLAVGFFLVPVPFIIVLPSKISGLSFEWARVIIYALLTADAFFITTDCFASFFNRVIQVEPMAPFQVGMGKLLVNVFYFLLVILTALSPFLSLELQALASLFIQALLTYVALDRIRMQCAQNKASEITEK